MATMFLKRCHYPIKYLLKMQLMIYLKNWIQSNNLVLILITTYFLLSIIKIEHPGVNNDQLMFVNTATFNPDNFFLWKSFHGIPTMVFPYIGALKSYLYIPVFHLFGVNIWSIRLPHIILISITWFLLYKTLNLAFNKKLALLALLFLCLDPSLIAYSKIDTGPTVLEFLLKTLAVFLLYLYLSTKRVIFFFTIYPVLALGVFNKINFIWFVNAFMISFILFYFGRFYNDFKRFGKLVPFLLLVIPYYFLYRLFMRFFREVALSYKVFSNEISLQSVFHNFSIFGENLIGLISGNIFFQKVYGYSPTEFGTYVSILALAIIFAGVAYALLSKKLASKDRKAFYFFLSLTVLTTLQILLTKQAVSAWHTMAIYPFITIIFAVSIIQIYGLTASLKLKNAFFMLIIGIISYQLLINISYLYKYSQPTKSIAYSSVIYDLIDFAKDYKARFICLDVDICNQLLSLTQQTGKYQEPFFYLDPPTYTHSFIKLSGNFKTPEEFLYVGHSDTNSHFPDLKKSLFQYLKDNSIKYQKIKEFKDGEVVAFEVYAIGDFMR